MNGTIGPWKQQLIDRLPSRAIRRGFLGIKSGDPQFVTSEHALNGHRFCQTHFAVRMTQAYTFGEVTERFVTITLVASSTGEIDDAAFSQWMQETTRDYDETENSGLRDN